MTTQNVRAVLARIESALASLPAEAQGAGAVKGAVFDPDGIAQGRVALVEDGTEDWHCKNRGARRLYAAPPAVKVPPMKLLGYANPSRIRMTCASKPGGAHLGQVAIYAGESVDPMDIQEQESPTWMGEPDFRPACYACGCRSDRERNWMGRSICSKCTAPSPDQKGGGT